MGFFLSLFAQEIINVLFEVKIKTLTSKGAFDFFILVTQ